MDIIRLPAFSDNYLFVLRDQDGAAVVDPGDGNVVLRYLQREGLALRAILITHHHSDHVGGNRQLCQHFPEAVVYGSVYDQQKQRIPHQSQGLAEGDRLTICGRTAEILAVPGHTQGHIIYYFPPNAPGEQGHLFCGDTLFAGGCGRLLEGNPAQMLQSLQKIRHLPDQTQVWCAHEYTLKNLRFAIAINPDNQALQQRLDRVTHQRQQQIPTVPSLLGLEKQTNPFLRWDDPAIQATLQQQDPLRVFTKLRGKRDLF